MLNDRFRETRNGAFKMIPQNFIRKLTISSPPLELQEGFAGFAAQIEKTKLTLQQSLDKLELLKKIHDAAIFWVRYQNRGDPHAQLSPHSDGTVCLFRRRPREQADCPGAGCPGAGKPLRRPAVFLTNGIDALIHGGQYPERKVAAVWSERDLEKWFSLLAMRAGLRGVWTISSLWTRRKRKVLCGKGRWEKLMTVPNRRCRILSHIIFAAAFLTGQQRAAAQKSFFKLLRKTA